jgi:hypothetical protein
LGIYGASLDLRLTQELLGHASPTTTAVYAQWDASKASDVIAPLEVPARPPVSLSDRYHHLVRPDPITPGAGMPGESGFLGALATSESMGGIRSRAPRAIHRSAMWDG